MKSNDTTSLFPSGIALDLFIDTSQTDDTFWNQTSEMIKNLTIEEVSEATVKPWVTLMHELWPTHSRASLQIEAIKMLSSTKETAFLLSNYEKYIGFINRLLPN